MYTQRALSLSLAVLLAALVGIAPSSAQDVGDEVRVRLFGQEKPSSVTITASESDLYVLVDGGSVQTLPQGAKATLSLDGGAVKLEGGGIRSAGQTIEITGELTAIAFGRIDRTYEGKLAATIGSGRLQIVNHVRIEPYVASVVASEYGFPEIEGVKAQAVLARTYALQRRNDRRGYDVEDHQASQVYKGRGVATETTRRAATDTHGEVLEYRGRLIEALYSSSSGGHTSSNETAWGTSPVPYLRAVPDPFDMDSPDHEWTVTASRERVLAALSRRFGGSVVGVTVTDRSPEGRVLKVQLEGARDTEVSGTAFQSAVNNSLGWRTVRSTNFDVVRRGDEYVFDGRGFGHGVGMSQYGARGQARAGRTYREILDYYFGGTSLAYRGTGEPSRPIDAPVLVTRAEPSSAPEAAPAPVQPRIETIVAVAFEDFRPSASTVSASRPQIVSRTVVATSGASGTRIVRRTDVGPSLALPAAGRVAPRANGGAAYVIPRTIPVTAATSTPADAALTRSTPTVTIASAPRTRPTPRIVARQAAQADADAERMERPARTAW